MGRLATDIGGTFTDLVYFDEKTGALSVAKALSTPDDLTRGVLDTIDQAGLDADAVNYFVHGGTTVINAITERTGAKTALVTTEGFRDVLEIARGNRPDLYNFALPQGSPLRAAPAALRSARAGRRQGPGPRAAASRRPGSRDRGMQSRGGGGHRHPVSSTPTPRPNTRRKPRPICVSDSMASQSPPPTRSRASGASTSVRTRPCSTPTCNPSCNATSTRWNLAWTPSPSTAR